MRRNRFLFIASSAGVVACGNALVPRAANAQAEPNTGMLDETDDLAHVAEALPPESLSSAVLQIAGLPRTGTVLSRLPPVQAQGTAEAIGDPGSCVAQSWGYCIGTYVSAMGRSRDLTDPANQVSAGWMYRYVHTQLHSACPAGSKGKNYLDRLVISGAPSAADFPYDPNPTRYDTTDKLCAYLNTANPSASYPDENKFLIGSYKAFKSITGKMSTYLPRFRAYLDAGYMVAFGGANGSHYMGGPRLDGRGVYVTPPGSTAQPLHAQVIVGYDDTLQAFLVQNSFGTAWNAIGKAPGNNGRIWYDYASFFTVEMDAAVVYPNIVPAGGTALTSSVAGGPAVTVHSAATFTDAGLQRHGLRFDISATGPLHVSKTVATGPHGNEYTSNYHETLRSGYLTVERTTGEFVNGTYHLAVHARHLNADYTFSGRVTVPS